MAVCVCMHLRVRLHARHACGPTCRRLYAQSRRCARNQRAPLMTSGAPFPLRPHPRAVGLGGVEPLPCLLQGTDQARRKFFSSRTMSHSSFHLFWLMDLMLPQLFLS